jgi:amino-acid N-acetyltransferase
VDAVEVDAAAAVAENTMANAAIDGETTIRSAGLADLPSIATLLSEMGLPTAGVRDHLTGFLVAERAGRVIGCAGLERYDDVALLRSVAVTTAERGRGLGVRLVEACLDRAREAALVSVSVLTETADSFFPRFGFARVTRAELPRPLAASEELRGACPDSAHAMMLELEK